MNLWSVGRVTMALCRGTDPDADRLGAGVRNPNASYTLLNGNQIGSIMCAFLCEKVKYREKRLPQSTFVGTHLLNHLGITRWWARSNLPPKQANEIFCMFKIIIDILKEFFCY